MFYYIDVKYFTIWMSCILLYGYRVFTLWMLCILVLERCALFRFSVVYLLATRCG